VARGRGEGGDYGCSIRVEKKTFHGGEKSHRRRQHPFKGGASGATAEEGAGELGDAWGGVREREGGAGAAGNSSSGRRARVAVLPRYSGGRRDARD
jgi:hypothetical protein